MCEDCLHQDIRDLEQELRTAIRLIKALREDDHECCIVFELESIGDNAAIDIVDRRCPDCSAADRFLRDAPKLRLD